MLTGTQPFRGANEKDLFAKISSGLFKIPEFVDFDAKQLLNKMLVLQPDKRPSASELLHDKWIKVGRESEKSEQLMQFMQTGI